MIYHDECIGQMLGLLDELGIADDTIVMYSTDNGPHMNSWPDAGMTPFRSEKNTNWEGAYRVPAMVRWPGHIPAGTNITGICSHLDWLPTLLAAAGEPEIKQKLLDGYQVGSKTFRIHLDGYNMLDYWTRKADKSPRKEFFYFSDDGDLVGLRYDNWKFVFKEQRCPGTCQIWAEPFVELRVPKIFNLLTDPYERADITSNSYWDWMFDHVFMLVPAQTYVGEFLKTFVAYPPRQKAASFSLERVMEKLEQAASGAG
jgi:arylsulfatase